MNQLAQQPPFIFLSPKCPYSNQLYQMLNKNQPLLNAVQLVNIHTASNLPRELTEVPAILHNGKLHVGVDTYKWVQMQHPPSQQQQGGGGSNGGVCMMQNDQQNGQIPVPLDTSGAVDFTPLPGQEMVGGVPSDYSYLPGVTDKGIDYNKAFNNDESQKVSKSDGMKQAFDNLQQNRGMEQDQMAYVQNGSMGQQQQQIGPRGGYSTQYQNQYNPYSNTMGVPNRM